MTFYLLQSLGTILEPLWFETMNCPYSFLKKKKAMLPLLFCRRHKSPNLIDDEVRRSSQEMFLNLEREHIRISPQVGIAVLRQFYTVLVLVEAAMTH